MSPQMQTAGSSSVFVQVTLVSGYRGPSTYVSTTAQALTGIASITIDEIYIFRVSHGKLAGVTAAVEDNLKRMRQVRLYPPEPEAESGTH